MGYAYQEEQHRGTLLKIRYLNQNSSYHFKSYKIYQMFLSKVMSRTVCLNCKKDRMRLHIRKNSTARKDSYRYLQLSLCYWFQIFKDHHGSFPFLYLSLVNPISTRGDIIIPTQYYLPPPRFPDLATALNLYLLIMYVF